jgi:hypothetical protein
MEVALCVPTEVVAGKSQQACLTVPVFSLPFALFAVTDSITLL